MRTGSVGVGWALVSLFAGTDAAMAVASKNVTRRLDELDEVCRDGYSCGGEFYRMGVYCSHLVSSDDFDSLVRSFSGAVPLCSKCAQNACPQDREVYDATLTKARRCDDVVQVNAGSEAEVRASLSAMRCGVLMITTDLILLMTGPLVVRARTKATIRGLPTLFESSGRHRLLTIEANTSMRLEMVTLTGGYDETIGGGCVAVGSGSILTLFRSAVTNCSSLYSGGAIQAFENSEVSLLESIVAESHSLGSGGAIRIHMNSRLELQDGSFIANSSAFTGGGVQSIASTIVLNTSSRISHCNVIGAAPFSGGGIFLGQLSTLIIDGGAEITDSTGNTGGCIYAFWGVTIRLRAGAALRRCVASAEGGALAAFLGLDLDCENTLFEDSHAASVGGGAIYVTDEVATVSLASTTVRRCSKNLASPTPPVGAAIATASDVVFVRSLLEDSFGDGAAVTGRNILLLDSRMTRFYGGSCLGLSDIGVVRIAGSLLFQCLGGGGVLSSQNSVIHVTNSTIANCVSFGNGGGVSLAASAVGVFENATFSNNTAPTGLGGAIFADNIADVQIRASQFESNSAVKGGAVSISSGAALSVSGMCAFLVISVDGIVARSSLFFYLKPSGVSNPEYVDARGQSTWKKLIDSVDNNHEFCLAFGTAYELYAAEYMGLGWMDISWQATLPSGEVRALDVPQPGEHAIKVYDIAREEAVATPCGFVGNFAVDSGGAIHLENSALLRVGPETVFSQNVAAKSAGAIDVGPRCVTNIRHKVFFDKNEALGGDGGAVSHGIFSSTVIADSIASGNRASGHGGFAFFDVVDFVGLEKIFATANVAGSDGGAIFFRDCRYDMNHITKSTFFNNTSLRGTGGGCATVSSRVDFYGVTFTANIAVDGGGVGVGRGSETTFFEGAWTPKVKVIVDWTNTTHKCIRDAPGPPWTCDRTIRECDVVNNFMDCRGCVCYVETERGAENYFELASSADTRYGQPAAMAVIVHEYDDLNPGNWTLSKHASRYSSWFGGSVYVFVDGNADGDIVTRDASTSTEDMLVVFDSVVESSTVNLRVPPTVHHKCEFVGNYAHRGGGACYWETDTAPAGLAGITAAVAFQANSASYGESVATPAKSLATVDGSIAPSGGSATIPLQITLNDAYQQRVVLGETAFATAIATVAFPPGASTRSNIAAFSENGIATFNDLVITYKPASVVNLSIFSPLGTLRETEIPAVVALRGCLPGEFDVDDKCQECPPRTYWSPADKLCHRCTHGMACRDGANIPLEPDRLLPSLKLNSGYMRQSKASEKAIKCHGGSGNPHCPGGNHVGCWKLAIGPTCQVCRSRYYRDTYQCRSCGSMPSISYLIRVFLWSIVLLVLVSYITRVAIRTRHSRINTTARPWIKLMRKWRLIFVALQILASVPSSFPNFVLPPVYSNFFHILSLMNVMFLPANCTSMHLKSRATFYDKLLGMIVGPVVACMFMTLASVFLESNRHATGSPKSPHEKSVLRTRERPVLYSRASEACPSAHFSCTTRLKRTPQVTASVILVTFVLYPMMSNTVVSTFWCVRYDSPREANSAVWYLQADLSLRCAGRAYAAWRAVAACALCTHVVGVPAFYFLCLYAMRHRLNPEIDGEKPRLTRKCGPDVVAAVELAHEKRNGDASISHLALLYTLYRPQFWYWEVLESIRRFLMSSAIGFISSGGDVTKVLYALILSLVSVRLYSQFEPFAEESDNALAEGLALMLTVTFFSMLIVAINAEVKHLGVLLTSFVLLFFAVLLCLVYRDMNREISAVSKIRTCVVEASRKLGHAHDDANKTIELVDEPVRIQDCSYTAISTSNST